MCEDSCRWEGGSTSWQGMSQSKGPVPQINIGTMKTTIFVVTRWAKYNSIPQYCQVYT